MPNLEGTPSGMAVPGGEGLWRERNAPAEESDPQLESDGSTSWGPDGESWVALVQFVGDRHEVHGPFGGEAEAQEYADRFRWSRATQKIVPKLVTAPQKP